MKNLKQVLALVLVIAMVMGFAVTASASEFSDSESIAEQNQTAVDVLEALGIINGFPDGSYKPEESVTRAQVAKMIACAFNDGDESINAKYANVDVSGNLSDVYDGYWAQGYIKYCYATGIMEGYPDGTFKPDQAVTGNELCQVMLNILGYELDTTNTPWATAVLAKSNSIGLLKNTSTAVGSACPRQEAAQIIFNALSLPILKANALGVLVESDETILSKYLNGSVETVVVTGNEEAALNDTQPLQDGKTEVDNETVLYWTTTRDMIGQSYNVWIQNGTVIYSALAEENNIVELSAKSNNIASEKAVDEADIRIDDTAEYFVNFDDPSEEIYKADGSLYIRVYVPSNMYKSMKADGYTFDVDTNGDLVVYNKTLADGTSANLYYATKLVKDGSDLSDIDFDVIQYVYQEGYSAEDDANDSEIGEILAYTQRKYDVTSYTSFRTFLEDFVVVDTSKREFSTNENGNYVKIVDNNGDGYADYVLKTAYEMAAVTSVASNGTVGLSAINEGKYVSVASKNLVVTDESELAADDVIVYAIIDGQYYINQAAMVTSSVSKVDINAQTITCGETTYGQSGIKINEASFSYNFLNTYFEYLVKYAETGVDYDLYLDNYGYVRAYKLNDATNGLALLSDAYYYTDGRTSTTQVTMTTAGAAIDNADVNVTGTRTGISTFIDTGEGETTDNGDRGTWKRLNGYVGALGTTFKTNVALYSGTAESGVKISEVDTSIMNYKKAQLDLTGVTSSSNKRYTGAYLTGAAKSTDAVTVYATTDTVYYYYNGKTVTTWTGYNSSSSIAIASGMSAYTVMHQNTGDSYYTADVIVIEGTATTYSAWLLYNSGKGISSYRAETVKYDSDNTTYIVNSSVTGLESAPVADPWFYKNGGTTQITSATNPTYSAYGIYASTVTTSTTVDRRNYVYLADRTSYLTSDTQVFEFNKAATALSNSKAEVGDAVIYVMNGTSVGYVIIVEDDPTAANYNANVLALYNDIVASQNAKKDLGITFYGEADNYYVDTTEYNAASKDLNEDQYVIEVSYTTALEWAKAAFDESTAISISNAKSVVISGDAMNYAKLLANKNETQTITVTAIYETTSGNKVVTYTLIRDGRVINDEIDEDAFNENNPSMYLEQIAWTDSVLDANGDIATVGTEDFNLAIMENTEQIDFNSLTKLLKATIKTGSTIELTAYDSKGDVLVGTNVLNEAAKVTYKITSADGIVVRTGVIYVGEGAYEVDGQLNNAYVEDDNQVDMYVNGETVEGNKTRTIGWYYYGNEIEVSFEGLDEDHYVEVYTTYIDDETFKPGEPLEANEDGTFTVSVTQPTLIVAYVENITHGVIVNYGGSSIDSAEITSLEIDDPDVLNQAQAVAQETKLSEIEITIAEKDGQVKDVVIDSVILNGEEVPAANYSYDQDTGIFKIEARGNLEDAFLSGDLEINISTTPAEYTLTKEGHGATGKDPITRDGEEIKNGATIYYGETLVITDTDGDDNIDVEVNGTPLNELDNYNEYSNSAEVEVTGDLYVELVEAD